MNREIKFRAWNREMKHMVYPSLEFGREIWECTYKRIIQCETNKNGYTVEHVLEKVSIDHILQDPIFEVMQFTGLHDKNGNEIYEGDILSIHSEETYGVIIWNNNYSCWEYLINNDPEESKFPYSGMLNKDISDLYLIEGNIFENPEILEQ
jgi:uncharacterized phage protein (TIGR01671 family)